ncbi:hypothetical protein [Actinomadura sp. 6N118]|uniref:hypothetical protein n=1 Tax=Actinomadura sp. 6N118 TaxID=3375151 RepID=UPI0037B3DD32
MKVVKISSSLVTGVAAASVALGGAGAAHASAPEARQVAPEVRQVAPEPGTRQPTSIPWNQKVKGAQSVGKRGILPAGWAKGWIRDIGPGDGRCAYVKITWLGSNDRRDTDVRKDCAGVKRKFSVRSGDGYYWDPYAVHIKTYRK